MSTPTIEQIHRHASVRAYRLDPVPADVVETIVAAGQQGSTSSNLQTYSVVAVMDAEKRARLAELCGNQKQILQAPIFLAWNADLSRQDRISRRRGHEQVISSQVEGFLLAAVDVAIAMQTAALAAESLGLGICYIGGIRNRPAEVVELLELPRLVFPVSGMTLGWPATEPRARPRLPLEAVLHWESYRLEGEEETLALYDRAMIETGIYKGRQVPGPGKVGGVEEYGWLEHSARRAAIRARSGLRAALERQGFELR
jgi:FMN reductase (NADPH)